MSELNIQERVDQLILALIRKTQTRLLSWEDVSDPDDEMFRTVVETVGGRGLIRIGRHTDSWRDDEKIPQENTCVTLWVYGSKGTEIAKVEYDDGKPAFRTANELFELAKTNARNAN